MTGPRPPVDRQTIQDKGQPPAWRAILERIWASHGLPAVLWALFGQFCSSERRQLPAPTTFVDAKLTLFRAVTGLLTYHNSYLELSGLIWLVLDKVEATHDARYIPLLDAWAEVDYRKVRERIQQVVDIVQRSH